MTNLHDGGFTKLFLVFDLLSHLTRSLRIGHRRTALPSWQNSPQQRCLAAFGHLRERNGRDEEGESTWEEGKFSKKSAQLELSLAPAEDSSFVNLQIWATEALTSSVSQSVTKPVV